MLYDRSHQVRIACSASDCADEWADPHPSNFDLRVELLPGEECREQRYPRSPEVGGRRVLPKSSPTPNVDLQASGPS